MRLFERHVRGACAVLAMAGWTFSAPAARADDSPIVAVVDQARLVKIPAGTETLIIGNPTIADVTLLKQNNIMILTPRSFGQTNFIALDSKGNPVAQSMIQVINSTDALIVQRGLARESYSCSPRCQPTERLGDDETYIGRVSGQAQAHTSRLSGAAAPTGPGLLSPAR